MFCISCKDICILNLEKDVYVLTKHLYTFLADNGLFNQVEQFLKVQVLKETPLVLSRNFN